MKILKIPFSAGGMSKTKGVEDGPDEIIKHLEKLSKDHLDIEDIKVQGS